MVALHLAQFVQFDVRLQLAEADLRLRRNRRRRINTQAQARGAEEKAHSQVNNTENNNTEKPAVCLWSQTSEDNLLLLLV